MHVRQLHAPPHDLGELVRPVCHVSHGELAAGGVEGSAWPVPSTVTLGSPVPAPLPILLVVVVRAFVLVKLFVSIFGVIWDGTVRLRG